MSMTLAEYERLCESGPLGSITPEDEMRMASRVHALAERYSARVMAEAELWKPKAHRKNVVVLWSDDKPAGIENSIPNGDR